MSFFLQTFHSFNQYFTKTSRYFHKHTSLAYMVLFYDVVVSLIAIPLTLYLRLGEEFSDYSSSYLLKNAIVFGFLSLAFYLLFNTYQMMWRYLESVSIMKLSAAIFSSILMYWPFMKLLSIEEKMPGLMLPMTLLLLHMMIFAPRFFIFVLHNRHKLKLLANPPLLIIGTNQDVDVWLKHAFHLVDFPYNPIGLITYKDEEVGSLIYDVPVVGTLEDMDEYLSKKKLSNAYCVILEYPEKGFEQIIRVTSRHQITLLKAPKSFDLMQGPFDEMSLVHLFQDPFLELSKNDKKFFKNTSVLICGAGAVLYQKIIELLLECSCKNVHLLDQSSHVVNDLRKKWGPTESSIVHFYQGSINDKEYLNYVLEKAKPDIVLTLPFIQKKFFHHDNLVQVIRTHTIAHMNLLELCEKHRVALSAMISEKNFETSSLDQIIEWRKLFFTTHPVPAKRLHVDIENFLGSAYSQTAIIQKQIDKGGPIVLNTINDVSTFITPSQMAVLFLKALIHSFLSKTLISDYYFNTDNPIHLYDLAMHMLQSQNLNNVVDFHFINDYQKQSSKSSYKKLVMDYTFVQEAQQNFSDDLKRSIKEAAESCDESKLQNLLEKGPLSNTKKI